MAFVVEDGTGLANSNAFVAVADADTYHADRGHASWAALDAAVKQSSIIRATDYICKRFGRNFRGRRVYRNQALEFPRVDIYDDHGDLICEADELPEALKQATAEYALRAALVGELAPDPLPSVPAQDLSPATPAARATTTGVVRRVSKKVDVIEESKTFQTPDQMTVASRSRLPQSRLVTDLYIPEYPAADLLLEKLLEVAQRRLVRG